MPLRIILLLIVAGVAAACGPTQEELDATATRSAEIDSATQTALAPTVTPTPTTTPTPTVTPTPTQTLTPTPTPTPDLSSVRLTVDDLPDGYGELPDSALVGLAENTGAPLDVANTSGFINSTNGTSVFSIVANIPPEEVESVDFLIDSGLLSTLLVAQTETIREAEPIEIDIGDNSSGATNAIAQDDVPLAVDSVFFRQGNVFVLLFVTYRDGTQPPVAIVELAELLQERAAEVLP